MTLEDVLKRIDFEKNWLYECGIFGSDVDIAFHAIKKKAIEVLEQETCEDAVSKQEVLNIIDDMAKEYYTNKDFDKAQGIAWVKLQRLSSVTTQKIGHWIVDVDKWGDVVTTVNGYRCDKCNTFNADKDNYCPNCGSYNGGD